MYRNIMVPIDGSAFSKEALLQGVRIARQCGATLRLVRVRKTPSLSESPEALSTGVVAFKNRAVELADLYRIANECRANSSVSVTVCLLDGPVADALVGYIARHKVDLVVMRSHARQGVARVWFGSVADKLIRRSGIPVLIVRQPSLATGLESGFRFKRILVPLDGSPLAEKSLCAAVALAHIDGATVTLLQVVRSHAAVIDAENYLNSLVPALSEPNVTIIPKAIIADDIAAAILQAAQSREIDMIAIATHGRGAVARVATGSVANRLMREAVISTMVVHPLSPVADSELVPVWAGEPSFAI